MIKAIYLLTAGLAISTLTISAQRPEKSPFCYRRRHLRGCAGTDAHTPNLDAIAARGRYLRAHVGGDKEDVLGDADHIGGRV